MCVFERLTHTPQAAGLADLHGCAPSLRGWFCAARRSSLWPNQHFLEAACGNDHQRRFGWTGIRPHRGGMVCLGHGQAARGDRIRARF